VCLDRSFADEERVGDLFVAQARRHHPRDLDLARRQDHRHALIRRLLPEDALERLAAYDRLQPLTAGGDAADAVEDLGRRVLLQHDAAGSAAHGFENVIALERPFLRTRLMA
jgi:hypothetical protein